MTRKPITGCAACILVLLAACGGDAEDASARGPIAAARDAAGNMKQAAGALQEKGGTMIEMAEDADSAVTTDPVDFRELRAILPEQLAGLPRTEAGGERSGAMGMTVSTANGKYGRSANETLPVDERMTPHLEVTVTDLGALRGVAMLGFAAWTMAEIDKESETGHERTTTHEGHPAYETFSKATGVSRGEIQVVVARRFVVEIAGSGLEMEQIRTALGHLDLGRLASLAIRVAAG